MVGRGAAGVRGEARGGHSRGSGGPVAAGRGVRDRARAGGGRRVLRGRGGRGGPRRVGRAGNRLRGDRPGRRAGLTDSKRLSPRRRTEIAGQIAGWVEAFATGEAGSAEIDVAGMTAALRRAAVSALTQLPRRPDVVLLDGSHDYIGRPWPVRCAVRADL